MGAKRETDGPALAIVAQQIRDRTAQGPGNAQQVHGPRIGFSLLVVIQGVAVQPCGLGKFCPFPPQALAHFYDALPNQWVGICQS